MRRPAASVLLLLAWACNGDEPEPSDPVELGDPPVIDPEAPPLDTGTAPLAPERPAFDCWADVAFDNGQDGTIDGSGFDGYDAANPTWLLYSDRDTNDNGIVETVDLYERDANGNTTRYERQRRDAQTIERTWSDTNLLLTEAIDLGSDGFVDEVRRYEYDPNGELLRSETDFGDDGELDYVVEYTLTPDGDRLSAVEDTDGDGTIDATYAYTLDDVGRETEIAIDDDLDEVVDTVIAFAYTDPVLEVGDATVDEGVDGVFEEIRSFAFDAEGRELYYAVDTSPDGVWTTEEITTRDDAGRPLTYTVIADGSPGYEYTFTYTYDASGRTISRGLVYTYETGQVALNEILSFTFRGTCE